MRGTLTGTLRYSPKLHVKDKVPRSTVYQRRHYSANWWLIAECAEKELRHYYRHLAGVYSRVRRPWWGPHVTINSNEKPINPSLWRKYEGELISFEYDTDVLSNGTHFWLPVYCERAMEIREELGLGRNRETPLHLTIANM